MELEKFKRVADCETFEELINCLEAFKDKDEMIQGRTRRFHVQNMINQMKLYYNAKDFTISPNIATREYGIRGKMMELTYYK